MEIFVAKKQKLARVWVSSQAKAIYGEWQKRRRQEAMERAGNGKKSPPYDKPNSYLKREVYRLVRQ